MNRTELREKLNKIDCENCNQYDLVNLFESVKLSNEDLNKLSRIVNNEKAVYNFLNEKAYPSVVFAKSDIVKSPKKLAESKKATTLTKGSDRNTSRINEALSKEEYDALRQLENGGNIYFQIANDDGEEFLIVDGWSDVQKIQKALDPSFEPEDEYDTSVLDDKFADEWGFRDEYDVCAHCNEVIRTSPDSYSWTADYFADYESGEMVCGDCVREDPANYLNSLINNPKSANTILDRQGLKAEGFELIEDDYENGWYDRSDNPKEILEKALEEHPEAEFVFSISAQEQFRTNFELWGRGLNKTLGEGANSMSSAVERQTLGYKKTKGQIQCNGGAQAKEVEDLLKAKYDNVTTQKGKGGKVIIKFSKNESLGESAEKKVRVHYYVPNFDVVAEETFDYDYFMKNKKDILDSYDEVVDIQVFDKDGYFLGDIDESIKEDFDDDEYDDFELASIYGGDFTYCPICGARMEYDEDGDHYCPKCKKSGHTLSLIRRGLIKDDNDSISESSNGYFAYHDQIVDALIARCQREGVLSTNSKTLLNQLAEILGVEQEDIEDESHIDINELIAFCQRQGVLPTTSDELIDDLESLTDLEREDIEELLDESLSEDTKEKYAVIVDFNKPGENDPNEVRIAHFSTPQQAIKSLENGYDNWSDFDRYIAEKVIYPALCAAKRGEWEKRNDGTFVIKSPNNKENESLSEAYKLRVGYKDKETNRTYSREYPYNGETNKKDINWLKDADKIAFDNCAPNEDVLGYNLVEVGEDESLSESNSPTIDEIISQFKSSVSDGLFDEETIGSMVDDMKKAKSSDDAFDIGNIYTNLNFFRFKDNDEIVRSLKRMGDKDVYFDRELAKPYIEKHQKNESLSESFDMNSIDFEDASNNKDAMGIIDGYKDESRYFALAVNNKTHEVILHRNSYDLGWSIRHLLKSIRANLHYNEGGIDDWSFYEYTNEDIAPIAVDKTTFNYKGYTIEPGNNEWEITSPDGKKDYVPIDPADEDGGWGKAKEFVDGIEAALKEDKAKDTMKSVVAKWRSRRSNKDESVEEDSNKAKKNNKNIAGIEHL